MSINHSSTRVEAQLSNPPTVLYIPTIVQMFMKNNSMATVLQPAFLVGVLTEADWTSWYIQQKRLGDMTELLKLMPDCYIAYMEKLTNSPNLMTGTNTVTDTRVLEVAINRVATSSPDSRFIALFNKEIDSVSDSELLAELNRGLLVLTGVEVYARINRGYIFKNAMMMA